MYQHYDIPQPKWDKKNKKWVLSIMIEGKRKQFVSRTPGMPGKRTCRDNCIEWLNNGCQLQKTDLFSQVFNLFVKDYIRKNGENEQLRHIMSIERNYLLPALGKRKVSTITLEDWQNIINNAEPIKIKCKDGSSFQRCNKLSKKYLKTIRSVITLFINWASPRKYMDYIQASQLYIPADAPTVGKTILQLKDIEKIFQEPTGLWYERAMMLEILTGMRPGEVLGLQRDDYDPISGVLYIRRSVNARGKITSGKNANARRTIGLAAEAKALLDTQLNETAHLNSEWIFCNKIGLVAHEEDYRRCLKRLIKIHGLPDTITPYSLRHTFFTHTEAYLPDRIIKSIFGHSEKTDGHSIYGIHAIDNEAQEAAKRLSITPLYKTVLEKKNCD